MRLLFAFSFLLLVIILPLSPVVAENKYDPSSFRISSSSRIPDGTVSLISPPLPIHSGPTTLIDVETEGQVVRNEQVVARSTYAAARANLANASQSERREAIQSYSDSRALLMGAILNSLITIYHKTNLLTERMETATLRLDTLYARKRAGGVQVPSYDARYQALRTEWAEISSQNAEAAQALEAAATSQNKDPSIREAKESLRRSITRLQSFLEDYRALAQDVVQAR
ncbi:MAG: hypothetical protein Q8P05_00250 [Candidatus Diapherotrites archaeon]|nr:hypothetical protein [Candidatus Diapherotrites archaeon]MDZ4256567.1 hypothetical protein [archaeon]